MEELNCLKYELKTLLHEWITNYNLLHDDCSSMARGRRLSISDSIIDLASKIGVLDNVILENGYYRFEKTQSDGQG